MSLLLHVLLSSSNLPFHFVQYVDFDELERDFMQLCKNAQMYNEEASLIHEDSIVLQSVFTNARQRLSQESDSEDDEDSKGSFLGDCLNWFLVLLELFILPSPEDG